LGVFFLLPFIGALTGLSGFPLFRLAFYILGLAMLIVNPILGGIVPLYFL